MVSHTKSEYSRKYYRENRDKILCKQAEYFQKNKERIYKTTKKYKLKYNYGLSLETWKELAEKQKHLCKICSEKKNLCVDHDHKTGRIRGLLCRDCNTGLGGFLDNIENIKSAIEYLEHYSQAH